MALAVAVLRGLLVYLVPLVPASLLCSVEVSVVLVTVVLIDASPNCVWQLPSAIAFVCILVLSWRTISKRSLRILWTSRLSNSCFCSSSFWLC